MSTENNILLAQFMGFEFNADLGMFMIPFLNEEFNCDTMKFHSDWNWLMEVVDKIESLGYNFQITAKDATVLTQHAAIYSSLIYRVDGLKKIEAVYQTSVEFIKWYNEISREKRT